MYDRRLVLFNQPMRLILGGTESIFLRRSSSFGGFLVFNPRRKFCPVNEKPRGRTYNQRLRMWDLQGAFSMQQDPVRIFQESFVSKLAQAILRAWNI
jgi:hypothetical protein